MKGDEFAAVDAAIDSLKLQKVMKLNARLALRYTGTFCHEHIMVDIKANGTAGLDLNSDQFPERIAYVNIEPDDIEEIIRIVTDEPDAGTIAILEMSKIKPRAYVFSLAEFKEMFEVVRSPPSD